MRKVEAEIVGVHIDSTPLYEQRARRISLEVDVRWKFNGKVKAQLDRLTTKAKLPDDLTVTEKMQQFIVRQMMEDCVSEIKARQLALENKEETYEEDAELPDLHSEEQIRSLRKNLEAERELEQFRSALQRSLPPENPTDAYGYVDDRNRFSYSTGSGTIYASNDVCGTGIGEGPSSGVQLLVPTRRSSSGV